MILKTYSRKRASFQQLIQYIAEDRAQAHNNDVYFRLCHNVSARSLAHTINAFQENDQYRRKRKNGNACYHTILSFAPADARMLTKAILWDIAQMYIRLRDPQALYFIQPHQDKDHIHLHCCISGNRFASRKATRQSRPQFYQLRVALEQYQQRHYPQLDRSLIYQGMAAFEINRLKKQIQPLYEQAENSNDFLHNIQNLSSINYHPKTQNITYNNLSFQLSDIGIDLQLLQRLDQLHHIEHIKLHQPELEIPF